MLVILFFGFWFEIFHLYRSTRVENITWIFGIVFSFFILLTLILILKKFLNRDSLTISTDSLQFKINRKDQKIPLIHINNLNFRVESNYGKNSNNYYLEITTTKKTLIVSQTVVSFWNFQEAYNKIIQFVSKNNLKIKVIKNFDNRIITFKQNLAKVILICVWIFIIYVLIAGQSKFY